MARPTKKEAAATKAQTWIPNASYGSDLSYAFSQLPMRGQLIRDLQIMTDVDETAGAMMYAINSTVSTMGWKHVACVDGRPAPDDVDAIDQARYADTLMHDMEISWTAFLMGAMEIVWSGVSPFEIVVKRRDGIDSKFDDGDWGVGRLLQVDVHNIMGFVFDEPTKTYTALRQSMGGPIELWKVLHIRSPGRLNTPWGKPLMSAAWRPWKLKTRIQDSEAMGIERELCGLPVFRMPEEDLEKANEVDGAGAPTPDAMKARAKITSAIATVSKTRLGPSDGLVLPSDTWAADDPGQITDRTPKYDFKLVTSAGTRTIDARSAARDHDLGMMRVLMLQFLRLGDRAGGSYGLSDDQSSMAVQSMRALAELVAAEWNAKVLPLLWLLRGADKRTMPQLSPGKVSKEGLTAIGAFLRGVGAVEALWSQDEKARGSILSASGIEHDREAQNASAQTARDETQANIDKLTAPPPTPMVRPPAAANANKNLGGAEDEEEADEVAG